MKLDYTPTIKWFVVLVFAIVALVIYSNVNAQIDEGFLTAPVVQTVDEVIEQVIDPKKDETIVKIKVDYPVKKSVINKSFTDSVSTLDLKNEKTKVTEITLQKELLLLKYRITQGSLDYYSDFYLLDDHDCVSFANVLLCGTFSITKIN